MAIFPLRYTFSSATSDADPGSGKFRLNNADQSAATKIYIDDQCFGGLDVQEIIRQLDDAETGTRSLLFIEVDGDLRGLELKVDDDTVEVAGYHKLSVTVLAELGGMNPLQDGDECLISFTPAGNLAATGAAGADGTNGTNGEDGEDGEDGSDFLSGSGAPASLLGVDGDTYLDVDSGNLYKKASGSWGSPTGNTFGEQGETGPAAGTLEYTFSSSTTIADPGAGTLRFSHATQAMTDTIAIDDLAGSGSDIQAFFRSWNQFGSPRGYLFIHRADAPGAFGHIFQVNTVTEQSGYFQLGVTHVSTFGPADPLANADDVLITFVGAGNIGTVAVTDSPSVDMSVSGSTFSAEVRGDRLGYRFSTTTTMADPTAGLFRLNNATMSSVTAMAISDTDYMGSDRDGVLDSLNGFILELRLASDASRFARYLVTAAPTDNGTWHQLTLSYINHSGALFSAAADIVIRVLDSVRAGDIAAFAGIPQTKLDLVGNFNYNFDNSTSMADPGSGDIRLNSATLTSVTSIAISDTDAAGIDRDAVLDALLNSYLDIRKGSLPTSFSRFRITGVTDQGTWHQLDVLYEQSSGSFSNSDPLSVRVERPDAREVLAANRTYYVRTDGSDSNNGLANTSSGAFLTLQKAVNVAATIIQNGFAITIQVGSGTYTAGIAITNVPFTGTVTVLGDTTTPSNVLISVTSTQAIQTSGAGVALSVSGLKFATTTGGHGLFAQKKSVINVTGKCEFGACANANMSAQTDGLIFVTADLIISGNAQYHYLAQYAGQISCAGRTVTLSGTPAFSQAFAYANSGHGLLVVNGNTYSGSATGTRWVVANLSFIETAGGGDTYFPGNAAGSTDAATFGVKN